MAGNLAVLYDAKWQVLRCEMLSENNDYGGWWTEYGCRRNVQLCLDYIKEADVGSSDLREQEVRRWRVVNLCNATLLGYGNRADVDDKLREMVRALRDQLEFDSGIVSEANAVWDWDQVAFDVDRLSQADRSMIKRNLQRRIKTSAKRNGEANKFKHRKELEVFYELL